MATLVIMCADQTVEKQFVTIYKAPYKSIFYLFGAINLRFSLRLVFTERNVEVVRGASLAIALRVFEHPVHVFARRLLFVSLRGELLEYVFSQRHGCKC